MRPATYRSLQPLKCCAGIVWDGLVSTCYLTRGGHLGHDGFAQDGSTRVHWCDTMAGALSVVRAPVEVRGTTERGAVVRVPYLSRDAAYRVAEQLGAQGWMLQLVEVT